MHTNPAAEVEFTSYVSVILLTDRGLVTMVFRKV